VAGLGSAKQVHSEAGFSQPVNSDFSFSNRPATDAELVERLAENYTDGQYRREEPLDRVFMCRSSAAFPPMV
jgi:hypothetical protein